MFSPALMDTSIDGYELGWRTALLSLSGFPGQCGGTWGNICPTQSLPQMDPTWDHALFCAVDGNSA